MFFYHQANPQGMITGAEIINNLVLSCYNQPLSQIRNSSSWPSLSSPLQVILLLIDFDTEVTMQGMGGFLENSTGAYLEQTIGALTVIGSPKTAGLLIHVQEIMAKHGVTHQRLRAPHMSATPFQITSFEQQHGSALDEFANEIEVISRNLYIYDLNQESPLTLLESYASLNREKILSEVREYGINLLNA